jgi:type II secretory pathway component PulK
MNLFYHLAIFGIDDAILAYIAITISSTYASYSAAQQQAKQSKLNAQAQASALAAEAQQKANETHDQQRRTAIEQQRFRSTQLAEMSGQGVQIAGTPLDILANTAVTQQQELNDLSYLNDSAQRSLSYQQANALAMGNQQAANFKAQGGATLLSGAANIFGRAATPDTATTAAGAGAIGARNAATGLAGLGL